MALRYCFACSTTHEQGQRCPRARRGSTRAWRCTRRQVLERDEHICQECGAPAEHVDHKHTHAMGGSDHPSNLQALCTTCNLEKGNA